MTLSHRIFFHKRKLYNPIDPNPAVGVHVIFPRDISPTSRIDWKKTDHFSIFFYIFPNRTHKKMFIAYTYPMYQIKTDEMLYPSQQTSLCLERVINLGNTLNLYLY